MKKKKVTRSICELWIYQAILYKTNLLLNHCIILDLSMRMSRADDRFNFFNFYQKNYKFNFIAIIRFSTKKCIKMSTNKPSIGSVVFEILLFCVCKNIFVNFNNFALNTILKYLFYTGSLHLWPRNTSHGYW